MTSQRTKRRRFVQEASAVPVEATPSRPRPPPQPLRRRKPTRTTTTTAAYPSPWPLRNAPLTKTRGDRPTQPQRHAINAAQRDLSPIPSRTNTQKPSAKWRYPDPQEWVASDDELARRRKKPHTQLEPATAKPVFAIGPTRKSRALNRKKLSAQAKHTLKRAARAAREENARVAPSFQRGSSASVRKLLTLTLGGSSLEQDLEALARFLSPTSEERAFRCRVVNEIREIIFKMFPDATVALYGSSSSGMETFRSDLDITVGNLDFSRMRRGGNAAPVPSVVEDESEEDEEDADSFNAAGYVVSDTDEETSTGGGGGNSAGDDDAEPTFSLNLSLPGSSSAMGERKDLPLRAASTPLKSPWNATLRRQKMRQLRALQQLLLRHKPHYHIQCLSKAKIPILMIIDPHSGLHMDLGVNREVFGVSDHGRTTTLVTELQQALGPPFFSIVAFLKELLHQFELDKPFTGGLGSYRLYMMVAYIFTTRFPSPSSSTTSSSSFTTKGRVSTATVLLTFLEVFGNRKKRGFWTTDTQLPVRHGALMDVVEFHAVFRLNDCVEKFAMAFDIISKRRTLGCVLYEDALQAERRACAKRILQYIEKDEREKREEEKIEQEEDSSEDDEEYFL